jgi:hypothetical protein
MLLEPAVAAGERGDCQTAARISGSARSTCGAAASTPTRSRRWYLVTEQQGYADSGDHIAALSARLDPAAVQTARQRAAAWQRSRPPARSAGAGPFSGG